MIPKDLKNEIIDRAGWSEETRLELAERFMADAKILHHFRDFQLRLALDELTDLDLIEAGCDAAQLNELRNPPQETAPHVVYPEHKEVDPVAESTKRHEAAHRVRVLNAIMAAWAKYPTSTLGRLIVLAEGVQHQPPSIDVDKMGRIRSPEVYNLSDKALVEGMTKLVELPYFHDTKEKK